MTYCSTKRKVILITDGDRAARKSIEKVAELVGGRCISLSAGNPTPVSGEDIVQLVKATLCDPVLVMFDDRGKIGQGKGEQAMDYVIKHPDIEVLGVVAVASNTEHAKELSVDISIDRYGHIIDGSVNKEGFPSIGGLSGDTVEVLENEEVSLIIGTGDTGKMDGCDNSIKGSPITLKAVEEILARSGFHVGKS